MREKNTPHTDCKDNFLSKKHTQQICANVIVNVVLTDRLSIVAYKSNFVVLLYRSVVWKGRKIDVIVHLSLFAHPERPRTDFQLDSSVFVTCREKLVVAGKFTMFLVSQTGYWWRENCFANFAKEIGVSSFRKVTCLCREILIFNIKFCRNINLKHIFLEIFYLKHFFIS